MGGDKLRHYASATEIALMLNFDFRFITGCFYFFIF